MYTSIILVCINGFKDHNACETYTNNEFRDTYNECIYDIKEAIDSGNFNFYIDEYTSFKVTDYRCINWFEFLSTL
jgi:hypothetical protein